MSKELMEAEETVEIKMDEEKSIEDILSEKQLEKDMKKEEKRAKKKAAKEAKKANYNLVLPTGMVISGGDDITENVVKNMK